jgi:hypothetical protein
MKGDYYRFIYEYTLGNDFKKACCEAYSTGIEKIKNNLKSINPITLSISNNYAVYHSEIENNLKRAYQIAREALDNAFADIDQI